MLKALTIAACFAFSLAGCFRAPEKADARPAFVDVVRDPPDAKPETADYLIRNDRPVAEYLAELGIACDTYGCLP